MRRLATARADSWLEDRPIAADVEAMELAMAVVGRTLFSMDFDQDEVDEVVGAFPILLDGIRKRLLAPTDLLERCPPPTTAASTRRSSGYARSWIASSPTTGAAGSTMATWPR